MQQKLGCWGEGIVLNTEVSKWASPGFGCLGATSRVIADVTARVSNSFFVKGLCEAGCSIMVSQPTLSFPCQNAHQS